jgi:hypothetical protein
MNVNVYEDPERLAALVAVQECVAAGHVALVEVKAVYCCFTDGFLGRAERLLSAHPSLDNAQAALLAYDDDDPDPDVSYELRYEPGKVPLRSSHVLYHPTRAVKMCFEVELESVGVWKEEWNRHEGDWDELFEVEHKSRSDARNHYRELLLAGWLMEMPNDHR